MKRPSRARDSQKPSVIRWTVLVRLRKEKKMEDDGTERHSLHCHREYLKSNIVEVARSNGYRWIYNAALFI